MNNMNMNNNMNNNIDISKMLNMLSKMDKHELEEGMKKASQILNSNNKNEIINKINNSNNNKTNNR